MNRATRWPQPTLILFVASASVAGAQSTAPPPQYPPGVEVTTRTTYYEVHGRTVAQLAADLRRRGPKGDDGQLRTAFTDSRLRWQFTTRPDGPACRAVGVRVTIAAEVLMPKWVPPADTEPGVVTKWNESMNALAVHEAGHSDIRVRFATAIRDRIAALPMFTCTWKGIVVRAPWTARPHSSASRKWRNITTIQVGGKAARF